MTKRETEFEDALAARELLDALVWCSAAKDFQPGGKARKGWLKLCAPLIAKYGGRWIWYRK